jgi:predicted PhzF superfamily epimerase YddE/YHI9
MATAVALAERDGVHQGDEMGRPSVLDVEVSAADDRTRVTGTATHITA